MQYLLRFAEHNNGHTCIGTTPRHLVPQSYILPNYSGESTIRIRNSMGTEVMNITLGLINEEPVKLDVSGLASGTYLVQVTYNGIQITRTIVKR